MMLYFFQSAITEGRENVFMKQLLLNNHLKIASIFLLAFYFLTFNESAKSQSSPPLKKYKIKQEIIQYKLGETIVKIVISKTSKIPSKVLYFNMHDNENTAVEATREILEKFGGTLVELQFIDERLISFSLEDKRFTFDPNRIFTEIGIEKTLKFNGLFTTEAKNETGEFAEKLKSILKNARLIIAVHNNTDENYSIKSYDTGGEFAGETKFINSDTENDVDDFFYITENTFFKFLRDKKQNVALQNNAKVADDGSLAVYCGKNKISYVNVESEHGHLSEQTKMLEILQDLIKNFNRSEKNLPAKAVGLKQKAGRS